MRKGKDLDFTPIRFSQLEENNIMVVETDFFSHQMKELRNEASKAHASSEKIAVGSKNSHYCFNFICLRLGSIGLEFILHLLQLQQIHSIFPMK